MGVQPDNLEHSLYSDQPIQQPSEDLFGRTTFAQTLAQSIVNLPGAEPFVFGLSGPWGSGKTSLLNMIEYELGTVKESASKVVVFRFNPWWFSGSDSLLVDFLHDFGKVLGKGCSGEISQKLGRYLTVFGHLLKPAKFIPGLNIPAEALAELASSGGEAMTLAAELANRDVVGLRCDIDQLLLEKKQPVLVIIDDVDRLLPDEVIQLFRVVKAVADFPYVRYLMAYDDSKVCAMVKSSMEIEGREFLEKIIQMPLELPPVPQTQLQNVFISGLNQLVIDTPEYLVDHTRFGNVFHDGLVPFLTSPRSVKRLLNVLRVTYPPLKTEVEFADFIALQSLAVFAPEIHRLVRDESHWFIQKKERGSNEEGNSFRERLQTLCRSEIFEPITLLLKRTFPRFETLMGGMGYSDGFESTWSSRAQAASDRHFWKYFRLSLDKGIVAESEINAFLDRLDNTNVTDAWLLGQLEIEGPNGKGTRVGEVLNALNDIVNAKGRLDDEARMLLLNAFFRIGDRLTEVCDTEQASGLFSIKNSLRIIWLIVSLIKAIDDNSSKGHMLIAAYEQGNAYMTMLDFARTLGNEHGLYGSKEKQDGTALIDKATCLSLISIAIEKLESAADQELLVPVCQSLKFCRLWKEMGDEKKAINWLKSISQSDEKLLLIIRDAVSESRSWGMGGFGGGMGDRVARTQLQMSVEYICSFFEPLVLLERAKTFLENEPLMASQDKETKFGLEELCARIKSDGTIVPEKKDVRH